MAAPVMSARSQSRQGSANQYRATSPNPYAAAAAIHAEQRARSGTASQYEGNVGVQLAPGPGEMAMYEPPGNADVSPAVCFMGKCDVSNLGNKLTFSQLEHNTAMLQPSQKSYHFRRETSWQY